MLKKLNTIRKLGPAVGGELIIELSKYPVKIPPCSILKITDLGFATECPFCNLQYKSGIDWNHFVKLEKKLDETCRKKLRLISNKVAAIAVKQNISDPIRAFIDAVAISDLDKLYNVFDEDVLLALKKILTK
ncbi:hypothetical protein KAH81_04790 [bacterium]|nr:hypothetical protein [bacterium]